MLRGIRMKKKIFWYGLAFLAPVILLYVSYLVIGISFSHTNFLSIDMEGQYISFFSYLQDMIRQGGNLFYSFSNGLGDNFYSLFTYYLSSPLNLIMVLFPKENIIDGIYVLTLLKIGLSGLCFFTFIQSKVKNEMNALIFSLCYALMGYSMYYAQNIMWMDGVFLFPLICLGIEKIFLNKKPILYIVTLSLAIISNYYIGFMLCIGSVLYTFYYFCCHYHDLQDKLKKIFHYCIASCLSGGLAAIILIPSIMSVTYKMNTSIMHFNWMAEWYNFFTKMTLGWSSTWDLMNTTPNIYCGLIVLVLFVVLFFQKQISLKKKLFYFCFLILLYLSMCFQFTDLLWQGGKEPVGFLHRQSFIFSFFLVSIVAENKYERISKKISIPLFVILVGVFYYASLNAGIVAIKNWNLIITFCFIGVYLCLLSIKRVNTKYLQPLLLVLVCAELFINAIGVHSKFVYASEEKYTTYLKDYGQITTEPMYRSEVAKRFNLNIPFMLNYKGMSNFSSINKKSNYDFLYVSGYKAHGNYAYYGVGSTLFMDSILGVKYRVDPNNNYFTKGQGSNYVNENALPMMFISNEQIKDLEISEIKINPFRYQNALYQGISGKKEDIFEIVVPTSKEIINLSESIYDKILHYNKIDVSKDGIINFELPSSTDSMYLNIATEEYGTSVVAKILDRDYQVFDELRSGILYLENTATETSKVKVTVSSDVIRVNNFQFYTLNTTKFNALIQELKQNEVEMSIPDSNRVHATYNLDQPEYIMTTIPYDSQWKITVNGKEIEYDCLIDTFIGFKLDAGESKIKMVYTPSGFNLGLLISGASLVLLGVYLTILYRKEK